MPRRPRLFIPSQPQHVVARGHNRDTVLSHPNDFRFLYQCLRDAATKYNLAIHAWVFMGNHIHLLVTPAHRLSLPKTMQSMGRRYVQYFNQGYDRTGSLWEGRYKCSLVDTEIYLLTCYRYIELNPVRAGIVKRPEDYPYSSYHANSLGKPDAMVTPHSVFTNFLGGSESAKDVLTKDVSESEKIDSDTCGRNLYRELCLEVLDRKTLASIRQGTENGMGIGQADFILKVARLVSESG